MSRPSRAARLLRLFRDARGKSVPAFSPREAVLFTLPVFSGSARRVHGSESYFCPPLQMICLCGAATFSFSPVFHGNRQRHLEGSVFGLGARLTRLRDLVFRPPRQRPAPVSRFEIGSRVFPVSRVRALFPIEGNFGLATPTAVSDCRPWPRRFLLKGFVSGAEMRDILRRSAAAASENLPLCAPLLLIPQCPPSCSLFLFQSPSKHTRV